MVLGLLGLASDFYNRPWISQKNEPLKWKAITTFSLTVPYVHGHLGQINRFRITPAFPTQRFPYFRQFQGSKSFSFLGLKYFIRYVYKRDH